MTTMFRWLTVMIVGLCAACATTRSNENSSLTLSDLNKRVLARQDPAHLRRVSIPKLEKDLAKLGRAIDQTQKNLSSLKKMKGETETKIRGARATKRDAEELIAQNQSEIAQLKSIAKEFRSHAAHARAAAAHQPSAVRRKPLLDRAEKLDATLVAIADEIRKASDNIKLNEEFVREYQELIRTSEQHLAEIQAQETPNMETLKALQTLQDEAQSSLRFAWRRLKK